MRFTDERLGNFAETAAVHYGGPYFLCHTAMLSGRCEILEADISRLTL